MPLRPPAGFIRPGYDPLKVPDAPTIGTATGGDAQASVAFTAPANVGGSAISAYYAVSSPGQITSSGASSPVTVTGLTNGTAYTFTVWALNTYGPSPYSAASGSVTPAVSRGIFGGGLANGNYSNVIQYVTISTTGNATDFGDLTRTANWIAACSSSTRGVFGGGGNNDRSNIMDYITIDSTGNAIDFGDLTQPPGNSDNAGMAGGSNSTRGLFGGGVTTGVGETNIIQYITIATTGNSIDFGDLTTARMWPSACCSPTRTVFAGGGLFSSAPQNTIDYVTTASTGNATDFGDLSVSSARMAVGVCSSSTRGLFAAVGATYSSGASNTIEYITIASTGNSTDFGDLTLLNSGNRKASTSSTVRGLFAGGGDSVDNTNVIDYVTIASTGNAIDFGDLLTKCDQQAGLSNAHGGL